VAAPGLPLPPIGDVDEFPESGEALPPPPHADNKAMRKEAVTNLRVGMNFMVVFNGIEQKCVHCDG
jgi:hypothetical protein